MLPSRAGSPAVRPPAGRRGPVMLLVALLAAGWLLARPGPSAPATRVVAGTPLTDRWPDARVARSPVRLPDGRAFTPLLYLDADVAVGTAPAVDDGDATRLLVRDGERTTEVARLPADGSRVVAVTATGDDLVWLTSTRAPGGGMTLHAASARGTAPARHLTGDVGTALHTGSQHDLVVADGRVHWAVIPSAEPVTEVRSVALRGGAVDVRRVAGRYTLSAWPWLVTAPTIRAGQAELYDLSSGARVAVPHRATEAVTCGPGLCRVLTPGLPGRTSRTELMRPDGARRILIAGGGTTPAVRDVALAGRFELLTRPTDGTTGDRRRLILYDVRANRSLTLADEVSDVAGRDGVVWWRTADAWLSLDLRTLT